MTDNRETRSAGPTPEELVFRRLLDDLGPDALVELLDRVRAKVAPDGFLRMLHAAAAFSPPPVVTVLSAAFPREAAALVPHVVKGLAPSAGAIRTLTPVLLKKVRAAGRGGPQPPAALAGNLLAGLGVKVKAGLLSSLRRQAEVLGEGFIREVEAAARSFNDLALLTPRDLQVLMAAVSRDTLALALRELPPDTGDAFYTAMSPRAATMLREDMAAQPEPDPGLIRAARREILEQAVALAAQRRIGWPGVEPEESPDAG